MAEFYKNYFPQANLMNNKNGKFKKMKTSIEKLKQNNTIELSDENRFQSLMRTIRKQNKDFEKYVKKHEASKIIPNAKFQQFIVANFNQLYSLRQQGKQRFGGVENTKALKALSGYIYNVYNQLNNDTILIITSDPGNRLYLIIYL